MNKKMLEEWWKNEENGEDWISGRGRWTDWKINKQNKCYWEEKMKEGKRLKIIEENKKEKKSERY